MQSNDESGQTPGSGEQPTPPAQPEQPVPQPTTTPQPGQVPPGYGAPQPPPVSPFRQGIAGAVPSGYGAQQQPPPGYGYPPPGYGYPPGQQPPPGYGYPPRQPAYVPPAQYHVPPTDGRPPQFVPPAEGTLFQAWRSLATNLSRQNYVAWAQAVKPGWVRSSVQTASIIALVYGLVLFLIAFFASDGLATSIYHSYTTSATYNPYNGTSVAFYRDFFHFYSFFFLFIPLGTVLNTFALPYGHAVFMSNALGTVRQRYERALKPWALAQVPLQAATGLLAAFSVIVFLLIVLVAQAVGTSSGDATVVGAFIAFLIYGILSTGFTVYNYAQMLQSGSVGSGLNRWAVFGINLLTGFVVGIAVELVLVPIFLVFFFHQFSSYTTTPSGFLPFH